MYTVRQCRTPTHDPWIWQAYTAGSNAVVWFDSTLQSTRVLMAFQT